MKRPDNNRITVLYERLSRDDELNEYLEHLKSYAYHIETCGEERNSYSKTDHDAFDGKIHTKKRQNRHLPLEFSIAMLACRNWTNQEIAEYLGLSMNTVKHYVSGILEKLGIDKRDKIKNFVNQ